jgi:hypothetical protein
MKKLLSIICLVAVVSITANAQRLSTESYPYWTISKGVQQLQYKNLQYVPSTVYTGNGSWTISKGVQKINETSTPTVKVKTGGTPSWVVSKGAARFQAEKSK